MARTSEVTFKQSKNRPAQFKGKVLSEVDACVVGRKVQIFRKQNGNEQKVDEDFASESGKYSARSPCSPATSSLPGSRAGRPRAA